MYLLFLLYFNNQFFFLKSLVTNTFSIIFLMSPKKVFEYLNHKVCKIVIHLSRKNMSRIFLSLINYFPCYAPFKASVLQSHSKPSPSSPQTAHRKQETLNLLWRRVYKTMETIHRTEHQDRFHITETSTTDMRCLWGFYVHNSSWHFLWPSDECMLSGSARPWFKVQLTVVALHWSKYK